MSTYCNDTQSPVNEYWICDECGKEFPTHKGVNIAGFGLCNFCIGYDWKNQVNKRAKEELIDMRKREEFSDLEYRRNLKSRTLEGLINLKEKYDKEFIKYWSAGRRDFPKFQPVSMEEFINRLRNIYFFLRNTEV